MRGKSLGIKRLSIFPRSSPCNVFSSSFGALDDSNTVFKYRKSCCEKKQSVPRAPYHRRGEMEGEEFTAGKS